MQHFVSGRCCVVGLVSGRTLRRCFKLHQMECWVLFSAGICFQRFCNCAYCTRSFVCRDCIGEGAEASAAFLPAIAKHAVVYGSGDTSVIISRVRRTCTAWPQGHVPLQCKKQSMAQSSSSQYIVHTLATACRSPVAT